MAVKNNRAELKPAATQYLRDENGKRLSIKPYMQGGVFSSDGRYLFLVNGKAADFHAGDGGIWAFDARTGRKITKSRQSGSFRNQFRPGGGKFEEPEGIACWDLDGREAPRMPGGQLHVILLDNDPGDDEFYLKHYRIRER